MLVEEDHLRNITHLFYRTEYEEGITEITTFIQQNPGNSNLYTNRALFLAQLDKDQEALKDLKLALSINPRNYISYFNIFSIKIKQDLEQQAYQNLCCSLSCLHLLKAKQNKNLSDVNRSIYFSNNNFQAHLLKGLILMEHGNHIQAFNSFQSALNYNPLNKIICHLRRVAFGGIDPETRANLKIKEEFIVNLNADWRDFTLKCSIIMPRDEEIFNKIEERLKQFNRLYNQINNSMGAITHKIPNQSGQINESRHSHEENVIIIRDSGVKTPKNQSQLYPQPGNIYIRMSNVTNENYQSIINPKQEEHIFHSILKEDFNIFQEDDHFSSILQYKDKEQNPTQKITNDDRFENIIPQQIIRFTQKTLQINYDEFEDIIPNPNTQPQSKQTNQQQQSFLSIQSINNKQIQQQQSLINQLKSNLQNQQQQSQIQQMQQQTQTQTQTQKYNILYPLDDHMKLKIKVLNVMFKKEEKEDVSYDWQKLTNLYCIISYNNGKLKTQSKTYKNGQCIWNQQFSPIDIAKDPSYMLIKLYNKRYNSIRDQFLADLQVLITTANKLLLPLHNKKGQCLGELLIELELVQNINPAHEL